MSNETDQKNSELIQKGYADGKRDGMAVGAVVAGAAAFISLLGAEKAILAFVLAVLAIRGAKAGSTARRLSIVAIILAIVYAITYIILLSLYYGKFVDFIQTFQKLS